MKQMNQLSLLALIMEHGPIPQTRLARLSRVSKPTLSARGETLIRKHLVAGTGAGMAGRCSGEKPANIEFNQDHGCLAVVEIDLIKIHITVTDLKASMVSHTQFNTEAQFGAGEPYGKTEARAG